MTLFKELILVSLLTTACPALLHCMDTNQETDQEILARCQQSGYLRAVYKNISNEANNFSNNTLAKSITVADWNSVAESIVAGCNLDCLFNNNTITRNNLETICNFLKEILNDRRTSEIDHTRITNFLQRCFNSKKIERNDLIGLFPPGTKNIHLILPNLQDPPNINRYKILLPVATVITLAAIAYKWWSKQAKNAPAEDESEDQTAGTPVDTPEDTLQ